MVILLVFVSLILFILADLAIRTLLDRARAGRLRREREEALAVSLKLDFTREAKTLKRAEVKEPVARLLCVDDEEVILDSFRKILVLDGYCVDTVQTGQEALGLIQTHHYDFVFTDLRMPAMDGMEVVKSVKHMRPDIDVVIITGFATVETAVECMKFGAMDYVQKPFTAGELLAFVKKLLIKRQERIRNQLKPQVHITQVEDDDRLTTGEFSIPGGVLISEGHCWTGISQEGVARVGLDDFARKLIGHIDAIEFPNAGMTVKAGQPLFGVRQKNRHAQFYAPVSGRVVAINPALSESTELLEITAYHRSWICEIDADSLDSELPALKIGKSAVALYQKDIDRFGEFVRTARIAQGLQDAPTGISVGELSRLNDTQWETATHDFFGR
jgi:CheY-like chemotaxis protein/glycine cleavage system H lipoate-binding protein